MTKDKKKKEIIRLLIDAFASAIFGYGYFFAIRTIDSDFPILIAVFFGMFTSALMQSMLESYNTFMETKKFVSQKK